MAMATLQRETKIALKALEGTLKEIQAKGAEELADAKVGLKFQNL